MASRKKPPSRPLSPRGDQASGRVTGDPAHLWLRNSMRQAEKIVDEICHRGGAYLYDQSLKPKLRPYNVRQAQCQN